MPAFENHGRLRGAFILLILLLYSGRLNAAPLEGGFALAPPLSASPDEKAAAYREARNRLVAAAGKYEHTPYRYGGADKYGLDCSGLVCLSFRDALGITVPRDTGGLYAWVEKILIEDAQPGDLVFFVTAGGGKVSHVGIYTGDRRFIHSASEGPVTGVIYSGLDERYWSRTYTGAGRVFPDTGADGPKNPGTESPAAKKQPRDGNTLLGVGIAPTWNTYFSGGYVFRGAAGQFRLGAGVKPLGQPMIFGLELRPEWDRALGVFRLPLTLSWGLNDKFRIFAGPALSFGNAVLAVSGGIRPYTGGTSWFGAAGITAAPFTLKIAGNELAPYGELAWQSYFSSAADKNIGADIAAGIRVSTGLRFTWRTGKR